MINDKELFEALMNGADPEKMANDFAAMLNAAIDKKKAEDARIQKEKAEAEAKRSAQVTREFDATIVLNNLKGYVQKYYPETKEFSALTPTDLDAIIEGVIDSSKMTQKLTNSLDELFSELGKVFGDANKNIDKSVKTNPMANCHGEVKSDPLFDFLRKNGL